MAPEKFIAQEVSEEPVIANPLLGSVKWHEEQIILLQELQHLLSTGRSGDSVAERTAEAIEDAGPQQEATGLFRQTAEDVFTQIIRNEAMTTTG